MARTYGINTLVRVTATFKNAAGALADPDTVTINIQSPSGAHTAPTTTRLFLGIWYVDVLANEEGRWVYNAEGTGAVQVSTPDAYFDIAETVFYP